MRKIKKHLVDGDAHMLPMVFAGYLRQVLDVDITKARLIGLERAYRSFVHAATGDQPGQPLALEQPMDGRARDCWIDKLAGDGTEVVEGQIKRALEFANNLPPVLAERGVQPMLGVRVRSVKLPGPRQRRTVSWLIPHSGAISRTDLVDF